MAKTYIPTLVRIVHRLCVYINRYRTTIREALPDIQTKTAFDTLADACSDFLDVIADLNEPI